MALKGKQKNIDMNNNNKIDAEDFAILKNKKKKVKPMKAVLGAIALGAAGALGAKKFLKRRKSATAYPGKGVIREGSATGLGGMAANLVSQKMKELGLEKKSLNKGGMFKGYTAPFETGASKGSSGTSTIVGVKPNTKLKGVAKRKKYRSMAEMRAAKGFKPGESASAFNKRQMLKKEALKAAKATRIGKIVAPIALAGVGAVQYLKSKMKKKEEPKKKMGGGMMRPMGYREGGTLGPSARRKKVRGLGPAGGAKKKKRLAIVIGEDKAYSGGRGGIERDANNNPYRFDYEASYPDFDIKRISSKMGGGMMRTPGYKKGKSVMAKGCKLGRKKPTKMY